VKTVTRFTRDDAAVVAAFTLGLSMFVRSQLLSIALLVPVLALTVHAALARGSSGYDGVGSRSLLVRKVVMTFGVVLFFSSLVRNVSPDSVVEWTAVVGFAVYLAITGWMTLNPRFGKIAFVAFVTLFSIVLLWVLVVTRDTHELIDVVMFQTNSAEALAEGINPYGMTFPDIYGAESDKFYGPGVSVDGVLQIGFPYPPLSLLIVAPFEWIFGDVRIALAIALIASSALMAGLSSGWRARSAATSFLLVAPLPYIVRLGWTEPLLVLGLVAVMVSTSSGWRGTSYVSGLMASLKQSAVLAVPSTLLLFERPWSRAQVVGHFLRMALIVAVTTIPFFLWNPAGFLSSVVEFQIIQPFRADSLAFPAVWAMYVGEPSSIVTTFVPLVLVIVGVTLSLRRTPTGSRGFALSTALVMLVAFSFSKQAFPNYYLLVIALLFAAAACPIDDSEDADTESMTDHRMSAR